jgi:hypothetical protein
VRFAVVSGFIVGVLLPVLETIRRGPGYWAVNFTTMFEDYVAGAFLVVAAYSFARTRAYALPLLLAGWAYVTGMMNSSFWYELEVTIRGVDLEANNAIGSDSS